MTTFMGYTHVQMGAIISEYELLKPLRDTPAFKAMLLRAKRQAAEKRLLNTKVEIEALNREIQHYEKRDQ